MWSNDGHTEWRQCKHMLQVPPTSSSRTPNLPSLDLNYPIFKMGTLNYVVLWSFSTLWTKSCFGIILNRLFKEKSNKLQVSSEEVHPEPTCPQAQYTSLSCTLLQDPLSNSCCPNPVLKLWEPLNVQMNTCNKARDETAEPVSRNPSKIQATTLLPGCEHAAWSSSGDPGCLNICESEIWNQRSMKIISSQLRTYSREKVH